ncbi:MAG: ATP-dependent DNA helicase RecG [Chloroflexi bacterium]|nr:ATP-dependent DNA helicase RecG [Chloroflexota bacterium]
MKPSIEKLQKIFRLEAERKYDNKAVFGGLGSMAGAWEGEARADGLPEDLVQVILARLRDYERLTPESRSDALKGLWARIRRTLGEGDETAEPAPTTAPETGSGPAPEHEFTEVKPKLVEELERARENPSGNTDWIKDLPTLPPRPTGDQKVAVIIPGPQGGETSAETPPPTAEPAQAREKPRPKPAAKREERQAPARPPVRKHRKVRGPRLQPEGPSAALDAAVTVLDGVGPKNAEKLARLSIHSLGDMLTHYPRRYDDYSQLSPINRLKYGDEVTVIATVQSSAVRPFKGGGGKLVEVIVSDGTGALRLNWFNQPWLAQQFKEGTHVVLAGKVEQYLGRLQMVNPEWELLDDEQLHTNRIVPVYPLTSEMTQRWLRTQMNKVVTYWAPRVEESLPQSVLDDADLPPLSEALQQVHFPDSREDLEDARARLAFDEIFYLQLGALRQKREWEARPARRFEAPEEWLAAQVGGLPYELTASQRRALEDLRADFASGRPMNRLLQGDVGSGKTAVAALAAGIALRDGAQAAVLAPTSILAEQHLKSFSILLAGEGGLLAPQDVRLMIGATPESEKAEIRAGLQAGSVRLVVGTHALLEEPVQFKDLQFAVIDEQHRFGVEQRAALRGKGENPHLLVMTATPIPRSLALTVYGDLDLTVMDEMPPGRQPVTTHVLVPRERERAYTLIKRELAAGRQAFIIYPLVEESDASDSRAAVEEHARLQNEVFSRFRVGLLHGRLRPDEKEEAMRQFRDGEFNVLVSTSVVEVGVDVPNATVMFIEGADRFGLAQLHQLRGRVGRGGGESFCLLIPEKDDAAENERLLAMAETNDGFVLAERDLDQRGPGEFLGTRQAGFGDRLRLASLTDVKLIEKARQHAHALLERDPELAQPEHSRLAKWLAEFWRSGQGDLS